MNAQRSLSDPRPSEFQTLRFGNSIVTIDAARSGSAMCNRVLGYGISDVSLIGDIIAAFEDAGEAPHFDVASDNLLPEVVESLIKHDLTATEALTYLFLDCSGEIPGLPDTEDIVVERWDHNKADEFLRLLETSGVSCEPDTWRGRRKYYCTGSFRTFVATREGHPCAWATSFVDGDLGYFANAFTQPEHRTCGCHSALLAARIEDARELGLSRVFSDVIADSPSHRNCRSAGFIDQTVVTVWTNER